MKRFQDRPLFVKAALMALPFAAVGALASISAVSVYQHHQPTKLAQQIVKQSDTASVLAEQSTCQPPAPGTSPPPGCTPPAGTTLPTSCPSGYTGTPPNCQPPAGGSSSGNPNPTTSQPNQPNQNPSGQPSNVPTTCPSGYTGTPPNCQ